MCDNQHCPTSVVRRRNEPYEPKYALGNLDSEGRWVSVLINSRMCCREAVLRKERETASFERPLLRHPQTEDM